MLLLSLPISLFLFSSLPLLLLFSLASALTHFPHTESAELSDSDEATMLHLTRARVAARTLLRAPSIARPAAAYHTRLHQIEQEADMGERESDSVSTEELSLQANASRLGAATDARRSLSAWCCKRRPRGATPAAT